MLQENNIEHKVHAIVGYDDIPTNAQKPNPFGGVKCLQKLFGDKVFKTIVYVGDHEGDVEFARNIERELNNRVKIIAVIVKYSGADTKEWKFKPDVEINHPAELLEFIENYK